MKVCVAFLTGQPFTVKLNETVFEKVPSPGDQYQLEPHRLSTVFLSPLHLGQLAAVGSGPGRRIRGAVVAESEKTLDSEEAGAFVQPVPV